MDLKLQKETNKYSLSNKFQGETVSLDSAALKLQHICIRKLEELHEYPEAWFSLWVHWDSVSHNLYHHALTEKMSGMCNEASICMGSARLCK